MREIERQKGFYWVRFGGEIRIAEYFPIPETFYLTGEIQGFEKETFSWIDDNMIEQPQNK